MEKIRKFILYAWGTLAHPGAAFERLRTEPYALSYGFAAILVVGLMYTIAQYIGYLNGFGPCEQPFLPIPAEDYYYYQTFFTIPVFWLSTLIFAAVVQFLSRFLEGKGKFEECVAVAGFSFHITMIPLMMIPEIIMFIMNLHSPEKPRCGTIGYGLMVDQIRMAAAALWPMIVTLIGVQKVQQFSWWKTLVIGSIGLVVYMLVFWTYIR